LPDKSLSSRQRAANCTQTQNNVKRPTSAYRALIERPMNPAHAPATSAHRDDLQATCKRNFCHPALLFEGIEFVSRTIMTD